MLIDAFPHGQTPGTVSIVEPDIKEINAPPDSLVEAHSMHPLNVLRTLNESDYGIKPISVAGGALKVKDELKFSFEMVARKQD